MAKITKRMKAIRENFDATKIYSIEDAVKLLIEKSKVKFDETVDVSMRLNIDTKQADQNIRGVVSLPNGTGKTYRVAVFAKPEKHAEAKESGADLVGADDLIAEVANGKIDFDKCIATPDMMVALGKVAKVLGPKGLMPNPKLGTVTPAVGEAVKKVKAGQLEYKADKSGIVNAGVGKISFGEQKLIENVKSFVDTIVKARSASVKGVFVKAIHLSSTMGVAVKIDVNL